MLIDVDDYILSREESEYKTNIREEMFGDYTSWSKRTNKTPFTPENYDTIPELFSQSNSSPSTPIFNLTVENTPT